jgi:hypothetical protein
LRIGACAGDEERNCDQQLPQRVFDAAPPYIKTVWQAHQEDGSKRDDNDGRGAKAPLRIADPPATSRLL